LILRDGLGPFLRKTSTGSARVMAHPEVIFAALLAAGASGPDSGLGKLKAGCQNHVTPAQSNFPRPALTTLNLDAPLGRDFRHTPKGAGLSARFLDILDWFTQLLAFQRGVIGSSRTSDSGFDCHTDVAAWS